MKGYSYITLDERRKIESMYASGARVVDIAAKLHRSTAALYAELKRGDTGEIDNNGRRKYSAKLAQARTQANFRCRGLKHRKGDIT